MSIFGVIYRGAEQLAGKIHVTFNIEKTLDIGGIIHTREIRIRLAKAF
jgi:hypothetical protein